MADEMKKVDQHTELKDEEVDQVTGGYSKENWKKMNTQERLAAYNESRAIRKEDSNAYCAYFDPNA